MNQKMTDEELSAANRALHSGDSSEADWTDTWGDSVFAHIAAVTAERDGARRERERFRDAVANCAACAENVTLRERVREVERERDQWRESRYIAAGERHEAESRLAAIFQRAGDVTGLINAWNMSPHGARIEGEAADLSKGFTAVARYIVGANAPASEMASVQAWKQEASATLETCAAELGVRPSASEPTTAEAFLRVLEQRAPPSAEVFAMAREPLTDWQRGRVVGVNNIARALAALSLLERRMGAMTLALAPFAAYGKSWGANPADLANPHSSGGMVLLASGGPRAVELTVDDFRRAVATLTDAPPVFTLEEVVRAMERTAIHSPAQRDVVAALNALRK